MSRLSIFRAFLLFAALGAIAAGVFCVSLAVEETQRPHERSTFVYAFDLPESEGRDAALARAAEIFTRRLRSLEATEIEARVDEQRQVVLACRPPLHSEDSSFELRAETALGKRGDAQFLALAEKEDFRELGVDSQAQMLKQTMWQTNHPDAGPDAFFVREGAEHDPARVLRFYRLRHDPSTDPDHHEVVPLRVPEPKWSFGSADFVDVGRSSDSDGNLAISLGIRPERSEAFGDYTESLAKKTLAFVVSGEVVTLARVGSRLSGQILVQGGPKGFTREEAREIVEALRSGPLPSAPQHVSSTTDPAPPSRSWMLPAMCALFCAIVTGALGFLTFTLRSKVATPQQTGWGDSQSVS